MSQADIPAESIDPIDLFAEAVVTKTAGALTPTIAKMLAGWGIESVKAGVIAENTANNLSGLLVDAVNVLTDIKAQKRAREIVAAAAKAKARAE